MRGSITRILGNSLAAIRAAWLIVGVTLLMLFLIEAAFRTRRLLAERRSMAPRTYMAGDPRTEPWFADYQREFDRTRSLRWRPYVYFRRAESLDGPYIRVDSLGHRVTPQPATPATPVARVRLYGGSTMWGEPQREDHTVAAEISRRLQVLAGPGARIEVTNVAETGYVFTQEVIQLMLDLRAGARPDVVVFYDGLNDVASTVQRGAAGDPQNEGNRIADFTLGRSLDRASYVSPLAKDMGPLGVLAAQSFNRLAMVQWAQARKSRPERTFIAADSAARGTAHAYLENARLVESLGARYGFTTVYVWQPNLHSTEKQLDPYEKNLRQLIESDTFHLRVQATHRMVSALLDSAMQSVTRDRFVNASGLFKNDPQPVFVDRIGHTTESAVPVIVDTFWPTLERVVTAKRAKGASGAAASSS